MIKLKRPLVERHRRQWRPGKSVQLVQRNIEFVVADRAPPAGRRVDQPRLDAGQTALRDHDRMRKIDVAAIDAALKD